MPLCSGCGIVLEGHVPAREIRRLLRERLAAIGLAVPSMPLGAMVKTATLLIAMTMLAFELL